MLTTRVKVVITEIEAKIAQAKLATAGNWQYGKTCVGLPAVLQDNKAVALLGTLGHEDGNYLLHNQEVNGPLIVEACNNWIKTLEMLKTAIEGLFKHINNGVCGDALWENQLLITLCDQWEAMNHAL